MKKLKIRTKIMLLFTMLSAILLGALVPTVYSSVAASLRQTLQARLQMAVSQVISSVELQNGKLHMDLEELDVKGSVHMCIVDKDGVLLYDSGNAGWLSGAGLENGEDYIAHDGRQWAVQTQRYEIGDVEMTVMAASSTEYVDNSLRNLVLLLLVLAPVYLAISAFGSFLLAKRAMNPIRQITQAAQVIGNGELSRRITGVETKDEVGELSETINEMLDKLEASFQRERQFTSDASHELRTPLAVISACAEDALGSNAPDSRESLMTISEEAERMTKIISQLLMLSRGYEGRLHLDPEQIALRDMLDSVCDELKDSATEKQIRLHNGISNEVFITADQSLMTQLMVNIIGNAIKYGRNGGNVWLGAVMLDDGIHITVADDGIGISNEDLPRIFERFYRTDSARDRSGFGLGLSIAKWIVELHRGAINVKSRLGHGTTFEIVIPDDK